MVWYTIGFHCIETARVRTRESNVMQRDARESVSYRLA